MLRQWMKLWRTDKVSLFDERGGHVLDIGCARGALLRALTHQFDTVTAVEYDFAAAAAAHAGSHASRIVCGDAQRLPFARARFDAVLMSEVLEHIPDEAAALAEVRRLLKPGGTLVLTTPHRGLFAWLDPMNFRHRFPHLYRRLGFDRKSDGAATSWHRHYSLEQFYVLLPGFQIEEVHIGGLFLQPTMVLATALSRKLLPGSLGSRLAHLCWWIGEMDTHLRFGRLGYNLWLRARRDQAA